MLRRLNALGMVYVAVCAALLYLRASPVPAPTHATPVASTGSAAEWFARIRPFCNSVEVEVSQRNSPPPSGLEATGYAAACFALAGRIDQARRLIDGLPGGSRYQAAGIVFNVAHPVADAGDDKSAGPIMEMVLEYWPNNYMALYHAGMAEYGLGQPVPARQHLEEFLRLYHENDYFHQNAVDALRHLGR